MPLPWVLQHPQILSFSRPRGHGRTMPLPWATQRPQILNCVPRLRPDHASAVGGTAPAMSFLFFFLATHRTRPVIITDRGRHSTRESFFHAHAPVFGHGGSLPCRGASLRARESDFRAHLAQLLLLLLLLLLIHWALISPCCSTARCRSHRGAAAAARHGAEAAQVSPRGKSEFSLWAHL